MRLDRSTTLPSGTRVRVRFPLASDHTRLRALFLRLGLDADDLEIGRALRFNPRKRTVACATAFAGGQEVLVGFSTIDRDADEPDLVVVDEHAAPGARALLEDAVRVHAARHVA